jgi:hypothetical protein
MTAAAAFPEQAPPSGPRLMVPPSPSVAEARAAIARLVLEIASARRRVVCAEQELPVPALDQLHRLVTGSACHDVEQLRRLDQLIASAVDLGARAAREGR